MRVAAVRSENFAVKALRIHECAYYRFTESDGGVMRTRRNGQCKKCGNCFYFHYENGASDCSHPHFGKK